MPFTPFHFGPAATIALIGKKYLDFPAFVLINVAIDIEPLLVMILGLNFPLHGYCHTFLISSLVAGLFAAILYSGRRLTSKNMSIFQLSYETSFKKLIVSSIVGAWFHIFIDALIYTDIKPFYPFAGNPLYGAVNIPMLYFLCGIFFAPALFLYFYQVKHSSMISTRENNKGSDSKTTN